jgi:hypothetical protein
MGWSAQALLHAALTWAPPPPGGSDSGPAEIHATVGHSVSRSRRRSPAGSA